MRFIKTYKCSEEISEKIDQKKELTAKEIEVVDINAIVSDVNLIPTTNEDIKVHFYGEFISYIGKGLPKLIVNEFNNQLTIEIEYPKVKSGIDIGPYKYNTYLDIYLSKYPVRDIKIHTISGNTNIKDLSIKDFHYETVSGNIKVELISSKKLSLKSISGDIKMENCSGELNVETTSGDAFISNKNLKSDIDVKTTSGNVRIELPEDVKFSLKVNTISGNLHNEFPIKISSIEGGILEGVVGSDEQKIVVDTMSGDIIIYHITK